MRAPILAFACLTMACDSGPSEQPPVDTEAVKVAVASALEANNKTVAETHKKLAASHAKLTQQLSASAEQLAQLGTQLDAIDKKLDDKLAAPKVPDRPVKPGRPDPKETYKVAVGDAHYKGPKDAKVTIVEWSDFQ